MTRRWTAGAALATSVAWSGLLLAAQATPGAGVDVRAAWVREAAEGQASTAAYFVIENHSMSAVTLIGAASPVAATAEIHTMQHTPAPASTPDGAPMAGMMRMVPVADVTVPSHGRVEFKPGSYHVMLFKIARPIPLGGTIPLTLRFADGTTTTVTATVGSRAAVTAPMGPRP